MAVGGAGCSARPHCGRAGQRIRRGAGSSSAGRGVLSGGAQAVAPAGGDMRRAPGVMRCLLVVAGADVALRTLGFARTLKLARALARPASVPLRTDVMQATLKNII